MSKKPQNLYALFCYTMSKQSAKYESSLVNRLNACQRYMGKIIKIIKKMLEEFDGKKAVDAVALRKIFVYLLSYDRIELWNPIKDNDPLKPDLDKDRLLSTKGKYTAEQYIAGETDEEGVKAYHKLSDVEKLRVNQLEGGRCGISIYRLAQLAYGVGTRFLKQEIKGVLNEDKLNAGEYDDDFLRIAKQYHSGSKSKTSTSKKKEDTDKDESDAVPTLEGFESGELSPSDVEDSDTLKTWYEQTESAGKKAAITKELNKRKQEQEN